MRKFTVFTAMAVSGYDCLTTQTIGGIPQPKTSGIFLPKIYQFLQVMPFAGVIRLSEFVTRAICGNKALRTNNATSPIARVEPLLHPHTVRHSLLTKTIGGISMLYKFLTTGTQRLRISIIADSLDEALNRIQFERKPLLIARLTVQGGCNA